MKVYTIVKEVIGEIDVITFSTYEKALDLFEEILKEDKEEGLYESIKVSMPNVENWGGKTLMVMDCDDIRFSIIESEVI